MKILFFVRRFYPEIGGVERHVLEISNKLVEMGNQVTVVTELESRSSRCKAMPVGRQVQGSKLNGIDIFRIPITTSEKLKKFQIWKWLWENRQLIRDADIIHCHDVFYWYLPFRFFYPQKKVFVTFHGYEGSEPPTWNKILSHRIAKRLTDGSMAIGNWHEKWYGVKPDVVSYGAVEDKSYKSYKPHKTNYDFCFIGRLAKDTGIMVYLEALKILKEKGKSYFIVVCGDGPQMNEAREYAKKYKLEVEFEGFVENVDEYLNKSKIVFVSRYLGILEALLTKKLIFAVYDSPIKEDYLKMAPFAGWILIEKDAVVLANKISYFANRPEKSTKNVQKGFAWAKQQSWDKLTDQYLELWGKLKFR